MSLRDYSRNFNRCDGLLAGTGNPESQSISPPETNQDDDEFSDYWDALNKVLSSIRLLRADHDLDGWPAIQMRDLVILHNAICSLRAGVREVIKAAVDLVCSPEWIVISDEEEALEMALRKAGVVMPTEEALRKGGFVASNEQN